MKKDQLKQFVEGQREEFELYEADNQAMWHEIQQKLDQKGRFKPPVWLKVAAVFALVVTSFVSWYVVRSNNTLPQQVTEMEAYYGPLTGEKLQFIKNNEDIDPAILQDLEVLDKAYKELKEDLKEDVDNQEVINAMIQTYRAKLKILEQILREIQNEPKDEGDKILI